MKLSLNWIQEYVDLSAIDESELINRLTLATCEVDGVERLYEHLDKLRVAKIVAAEPHPDAQKLQVCQVDVGEKNRLQIVCGAPNAAAESYAILAPIGATLPAREEEAEPLVIRKAKLRGVDSYGMLCSANEVGIAELASEEEGLLLLDKLPFFDPANHPPGTSLSRLLPFADTVLEIDNKSITHRPDLWCHFGFAREIAAIFRLPLKSDPLRATLPAAESSVGQREITIEPGAAHSYYGLECNGVVVGPSPIEIQARLIAIGQKPINNVVDASNYVMFELGQPNHTFDIDQFQTNHISVAANRKLEDGTLLQPKFTTLDEVEREIPEGSILIFDGELPTSLSTSGKKSKGKANSKGTTAVALAGVMGGLNSGIRPTTRRLFLESATFPREKIRATLSRVALRSDSAQRFEKGQDPAKSLPAIARVVEILQQSCPDLKVGEPSGSQPSPDRRSQIECSLSFLQKRLGFAIRSEDATDILERLHFELRQRGNQLDPQFQVTAPTWRSWYDVTLPEDIVEELGRIHGYDNITPVAPMVACDTLPEVNRERNFEREIKQRLIDSFRLNETLNYSFATATENLPFGDEGVLVRNLELNTGRNRLRKSLLPGLLRHGVVNQDRFSDVRLFEIGRSYHKQPSLPSDALARERSELSILWLPDLEKIEREAAENRETLKADGGALFAAFLEFRLWIEGVLDSVAPGSFILKRIIEPTAQPWLHPGCALRIEFDGEVIGDLGMLHPSWQEEYGLRRSGIVAQLDFERLWQIYESARKKNIYTPPSIYPGSDFEFSLLLDETTPTDLPLEVIGNLALEEIDSITLLNIYRGKPLQEQQKSVSYRVDCHRHDATLSGERLQEILQSCIDALSKAGYPLR